MITTIAPRLLSVKEKIIVMKYLAGHQEPLGRFNGEGNTVLSTVLGLVRNFTSDEFDDTKTLLQTLIDLGVDLNQQSRDGKSYPRVSGASGGPYNTPLKLAKRIQDPNIPKNKRSLYDPIIRLLENNNAE